MLVASGIRVAYGKVEAVRGVDLTIAPGEIVAIIGPNGAGKSSLLNALAGLLPHGGTVAFLGRPLAGATLEDRVAAGLCLVPETRALFGSMSVEENLVLGGFARRREGARALEAARDAVRGLFPRLRERAGQTADTLSGGERQMLALARALLARPKLLLLDEPSLGLAPRITKEIFRKLLELRAGGVSILLVEQNARAALAIADRGHVIEGGRTVLSGPAAALRHDPRVVATYLGGGGSTDGDAGEGTGRAAGGAAAPGDRTGAP